MIREISENDQLACKGGGWLRRERQMKDARNERITQKVKKLFPKEVYPQDSHPQAINENIKKRMTMNDQFKEKIGGARNERLFHENPRMLNREFRIALEGGQTKGVEPAIASAEKAFSSAPAVVGTGTAAFGA